MTVVTILFYRNVLIGKFALGFCLFLGFWKIKQRENRVDVQHLPWRRMLTASASHQRAHFRVSAWQRMGGTAQWHKRPYWTQVAWTVALVFLFSFYKPSFWAKVVAINNLLCARYCSLLCSCQFRGGGGCDRKLIAPCWGAFILTGISPLPKRSA